jgi:uncharacterized protein
LKIGLISDTHDNIHTTQLAVNFFKKIGVEHILHAGDICSSFVVDILGKSNIPITAVYGNNHGDKFLLKDKFSMYNSNIYEGHTEVTINNKKIFITHDPKLLRPIIASQIYDIVVYGHTHKPNCEKIKKTLILNPGECSTCITGNAHIGICDLEDMQYQQIIL